MTAEQKVHHARQRLQRALTNLASAYGSPGAQAREAVDALDAYLNARDRTTGEAARNASWFSFVRDSIGPRAVPPPPGDPKEKLRDPRPEAGR